MSTLICLTENQKYNFKSELLSEALHSYSKLYWFNIFQKRLLRGKRPYIRTAIKDIKNHNFNALLDIKYNVLFLFSLESYILFFRLILIIKGDELLKFKHKGILWGPLIYDTILRHENLTTIEDLSIKRIWNFINFIIEFKSVKYLINKFGVSEIICSDATYLNNGGIAVRLAEKKKIKVYLTSSSDFYNMSNYKLRIAGRDYFKYVDNISVNPELLEQFELFKRKKFDPQNYRDETLPYMKVSAYSKTLINNYIEKGSIIIFAHDFLDAFHYTGIEMFKDYFSWLKNVCEAIKESSESIKYYIKPHPNSNAFVIAQTSALIKSYKDERIALLNEMTNNRIIFSCSPKFVVSLRGNVLYEAALFGIKSLAGNDSQYLNFEFVHSAKSKVEFMELLTCQKEFHTKINDSGLISFYINHYSKIDNNLTMAEDILNKFNRYNLDKDYFLKVKGNREILLKLLKTHVGA